MNATELPEWMNPKAFACWYGVSYRTVMRYLNAGMPAAGRRKHARRIAVAAAVVWLSALEKRKRGRPRNVDR